MKLLEGDIIKIKYTNDSCEYIDIYLMPANNEMIAIINIIYIQSVLSNIVCLIPLYHI